MLPEASNIPIGILLGLGAGASQSVSYVFSRLFVLRRGGGPLRLLIAAHVMMGLASAAMVPLLWSDAVPPLSTYVWRLLAVSGAYMVGQAVLFFVLRHADASRIAPLLGLKIVILAVIVSFLPDDRLGVLEWAAVVLAVAAAFLLNRVGGTLGGWVIAGVVFACLAYCVSDLSIVALVEALRPVGPIRSIVLAAALSYVVCGIAAVAMLPVAGLRAMTEWRYAAPFAGAWFAGMLFLFACFATIGPVFGNITQSTRGLISILIGAHVAGLGMEHLETRHPRGVLLRRLAAAGLMTAAIALYSLGTWMS